MPDEESQPAKLADLSLRYNLEKEPLQTGRQGARVGLRTRAATALADWYVRVRMAGWLVLLLVILLLVAGIVVIKYAGDFWSWLVALYQELASK